MRKKQIINLDEGIILSDGIDNDECIINDELELEFNQELDLEISDIKDIDNFELIFNLNTNKHRQEGKHALNRDTIFKGKNNKDINDMLESDGYIDSSDVTESKSDNEGGNIFDQLSNTEDDSYINIELSKDVFDVLSKYTDIDLNKNRRKPFKDKFNEYYNILLEKLYIKYTRSEIFVELSFYFTDNIFNVFKLLDKKTALLLIKELKQKGFLKKLDTVKFK